MEQQSHVTLPLPVLPLENGFFRLIQPTRQIMFDVGLSFNAPNSTSFLRRNPDSMVLAFEPNPYHYFSYHSAVDFSENLWTLSNRVPQARVERRKRRKSRLINQQLFGRNTEEFLPKDLRPRFFPIPVAICEENYSLQKLKLSPHAGSSSLDESWKGLGERPEVVDVLGMRLDFFIQLVPPSVSWITHLKVDAEGSDKVVLQSAGESLQRFIFVSVEEGVTEEWMAGEGFSPYRTQKGALTYINERYRGNPSQFDVALRV